MFPATIHKACTEANLIKICQQMHKSKPSSGNMAWPFLSTRPTNLRWFIKETILCHGLHSFLTDMAHGGRLTKVQTFNSLAKSRAITCVIPFDKVYYSTCNFWTRRDWDWNELPGSQATSFGFPLYLDTPGQTSSRLVLLSEIEAWFN